MEDDGVLVLYDGSIVTTDHTKNNPNPFSIKVGLTHILRGGVIVEVSDPRQAKIAENAGACCISITGDQRGIGRMADPFLIKEIKRSVSVPIIAKSRVGHFVEAQILESIGSDYIDENELLSVADEDNFINKHNFRVPFVCGSRDLGGALRRIREVVHFASGGIITPADAALMMQLGCDGVFVGPEVFDGVDPFKNVRAIVEALRNYNDPVVLAEVCSGLSDAVARMNINDDKRVVEVRRKLKN